MPDLLRLPAVEHDTLQARQRSGIGRCFVAPPRLRSERQPVILKVIKDFTERTDDALSAVLTQRQEVRAHAQFDLLFSQPQRKFECLFAVQRDQV